MLLACGPSAFVDDGDASSGGNTSSESNASSEAEATSAAESSSGMPTLEPVPPSCASQPTEGVDPLAGDVACETYYGTAGPPAFDVQVRIVNRTQETIVVDAVGSRWVTRHFDVGGSMGTREVEGVPSHCGIDWDTCDPDAICDLLGDPPPAPVAISPGGWHGEDWRAVVISNVTLPAACTPAERMCAAPLRVSAGTYELRAHAILASQASACECEPDARGSCNASGETCTVEPTITAVAQYDGVCDSVEIAFE